MLALKQVKQRVEGYLLSLLTVAGVIFIAIADLILSVLVLIVVFLALIVLIVFGLLMDEYTRGRYMAIILSMTDR